MFKIIPLKVVWFMMNEVAMNVLLDYKTIPTHVLKMMNFVNLVSWTPNAKSVINSKHTSLKENVKKLIFVFNMMTMDVLSAEKRKSHQINFNV